MSAETETMDRDQFYELAASDGYDHDDPADMVTLAAYVVGPNLKRVASFLGRPRSWCAEAARNLRQGGVWVGSKIAIEGDELDGVTIAIHSAVAKGWLEVADTTKASTHE